MIRVQKLVVILILTMLISALPVNAQTDQGFEWGFAYDDEIHFMMHLNGTGFQIDEEIYLVSNDTLLTIPDSMDNWTDIPYTVMNAYYANGTQLGIEILTFVAMYNVYLPIGNWALLSTLAQTTHTVENFTLDTEDPFFWGYSWADADWVLHAGQATVYSNYTLYVHVAYLKTDGFLTHYSVDAYNTTTGADTGEVTLERIGIEQYSETIEPVIDHPSDLTYYEGQQGNSISWHASDDYPSRYEIRLDGTLSSSGSWNLSSEVITVNVDGHSIGVYNYTVTVYDVRGNSASDTVLIVVEPAIIPWSSMIIVVAAGVVIIGVIVVIAVLIRRR
ncbi:MAG: hypothetical protein ACFFF9_11795 [Candidatus Thorarchaeota archaeon]